MVPGNRVQGETHIAITRHGVHGAVVIKATREGRKARLKYGQKVAPPEEQGAFLARAILAHYNTVVLAVSPQQ